MATVIQIADAVVDQLQTATLSLPFSVERWFVPVRDLKDFPDLGLIVSVFPTVWTGQLLDRSRSYMMSYQTVLGIQKIIGEGIMSNADIVAAIDPLMTFVEEVVGLFTKQPLAAFPEALCTGFENDPTYSHQDLDEKRLFTSVIKLTFKIGK